MERESKIEDLNDDCDMYDIVEYVESVLPSELDDSDVNDRLVGVSTSDADDIDAGSAGTGVRGWSGECGAAVVGV
jgi:hypothetical protein